MHRTNWMKPFMEPFTSRMIPELFLVAWELTVAVIDRGSADINVSNNNNLPPVDLRKQSYPLLKQKMKVHFIWQPRI